MFFNIFLTNNLIVDLLRKQNIKKTGINHLSIPAKLTITQLITGNDNSIPASVHSPLSILYLM